MSIGAFFHNRKIKQLSDQFTALIEQGEVPAALDLYMTSLAADASSIDPRVRVIYHLHCWLASREIEHLNAVEALAENQPEASSIRQAVRTIRRFQREANLAEALRQRNPSRNMAPAEAAFSDDSNRSEQLALAILETYWISRGIMPRQVATAVQRLLPDAAPFEGRAQMIYRALLVWSHWTLQQYAPLAQNGVLQPESRAFKLTVLYAWGMNELREDRITSALKVLEALQRLVSSDEAFDAALQWALGALKAGHAATATYWLEQLALQKLAASVPSKADILSLALGLSYLMSGRHAAGREQLARLLVGNAPLEVQSQALFLQGLSQISEVQSWAAPEHSDDAQAADELLMRNRTLWGRTRADLLTLVETLEALPPANAWPGYLLRGLLAYVGGLNLSLDQLKRFSQAIEYLRNPEGRIRLRTVEGALLTRAKATEEAIDCIKRQDRAALRTLYDQVLTSLGDAIPPLVRAMVVMTLWQGDPSFDPLPELEQLSVSPEHATLVAGCVSQVKAVAVARRLSQLCTAPLSTTTEIIPPALPALVSQPELEQLESLATAALHLRHGAWRLALGTLPSLKDSDRQDLQQLAAFIKFYASWQLGEFKGLLAARDNPYLDRFTGWQRALAFRQIVSALEAGDERRALDLLKGLKIQTGPKAAPGALLRIVSWLIRRQLPQSALRLLKLGPENPLAMLLTAITMAQLGQYTASGEACERVLNNTAAGDIVRERARLLRLQVELASIAGLEDGLRERWPAVRRNLLEQAVALQGTPELQAYGFLIQGLIVYLTTDTLVDDQIRVQLLEAQRVLALPRHAAFLQQAIGQLDWRSTVITDFWNGLQRGDLQASRSIYGREIGPAFVDRVPPAIQLGMVIVEWDARQTSTQTLLNRLATLEQEAPELTPQLIQKVRSYIKEADQIRHFTSLVRDNDFEAIIDFVARSEWSQSGIPLAVAVALLYAYYKKEHMSEAKRFSELIADDTRLPEWVRNYGFFIKGYVFFREQDFPQAAAAFEQVKTGVLLGHDVDKYWAVAHFSHGLQLLQVDQKEEAFKAFRRSLSQRGISHVSNNLAPLFAYFGWKNILARNGTQALQAFTLMQESLTGLTDNETMLKERLAARIGDLLARSLMAQDARTIPGGEPYLDLLIPLDHANLDPHDKSQITATLHQMAVAQELRRQRLLDTRQRRSKADLRAFLEQQVENLNRLGQEDVANAEAGDRAIKHDPTLLVLQALILLRLYDRPNHQGALERLTQVTRLGVYAPRLMELLATLQKERAQAAEQKGVLLDLFDVYLTQGAVPPELRNQIGRQDDLAELYRLGRSYMPVDLSAAVVQSSIDILTRRVAHLICAWSDGVSDHSPEFAALIAQLREQLKSDDKPDEALVALLRQGDAQLRRDHPVSKLLGELCTHTVSLKELEQVVLGKEAQVLDVITRQLNLA